MRSGSVESSSSETACFATFFHHGTSSLRYPCLCSVGYLVTPSRALRTLGEEAWGGQADRAGQDGADDGWVDEDLKRRRGRGQAEDGLQGVVRVGEGDEAPERLENTCWVLVAEEA